MSVLVSFLEKSRVAYIFDVSRFPPYTEYNKCNRLLSGCCFSFTLKEDISDAIVFGAYSYIKIWW